MERQCTRCKTIKGFEHFHKCSKSKIGIREVCKVCRRAIAIEYRNNSGDSIRERDRERKTRKIFKTYIPGSNKSKAHGLSNYYLKSGKIKKLPCEFCGTEENIVGHHDDYLKPLDLRFLCKKTS